MRVDLMVSDWRAALPVHRISPEVDQDRYYLLQDLVMTGEVSRFGFVRGVGAYGPPLPRRPPAFVSVIRCPAAALVDGQRGS